MNALGSRDEEGQQRVSVGEGYDEVAEMQTTGTAAQAAEGGTGVTDGTGPVDPAVE